MRAFDLVGEFEWQTSPAPGRSRQWCRAPFGPADADLTTALRHLRDHFAGEIDESWIAATHAGLAPGFHSRDSLASNL